MASRVDLDLLGKVIAEVDVALNGGASVVDVVEQMKVEHGAEHHSDGELHVFLCAGATGKSKRDSAAALLASWRSSAERLCGKSRNDAPPRISAGDDRLRLLVERYERLDEEQKGIGQDKADVLAEAKAVGYDRVGFKEVIRLRAMTADDRAERDAIIDTYRHALGID